MDTNTNNTSQNVVSMPKQGDQVFACPYCGTVKSEEDNNCCGENHCTWMSYNEETGLGESQDEQY